jgi:hypothetical protein
LLIQVQVSLSKACFCGMVRDGAGCGCLPRQIRGFWRQAANVRKTSVVPHCCLAASRNPPRLQPDLVGRVNGGGRSHAWVSAVRTTSSVRDDAHGVPVPDWRGEEESRDGERRPAGGRTLASGTGKRKGLARGRSACTAHYRFSYATGQPVPTSRYARHMGRAAAIGSAGTPARGRRRLTRTSISLLRPRARARTSPSPSPPAAFPTPFPPDLAGETVIYLASELTGDRGRFAFTLRRVSLALCPGWNAQHLASFSTIEKTDQL